LSTTIDTEHFHKRLQEERKRVKEAIDYLHEENPGNVQDETQDSTADNHPADVATVTFDRELDYSLEENEERLLGAIDAALARIDEGTYGICTACGQPIGEERLEALPWTTQCIDCKRKEERG
jgi:RNA polymerase-binding protein DksA